jgi:predicted O-methyltransferase YrrM
MVVPLGELLILGAVCRHLQPRRIFELGTYTGSSTLVMAMNAPETTELITLDYNTSEIVGSAFRGTAHALNIRQLHGDSREYDYEPYLGDIDLILVDANHTYEFVKADTDTAFRLLKPGGVIVWDDYRWLDIHSECQGVTFCLNELQRSHPVFHITGTRFAIYLDDATRVYEKA